MKLNETQLKEIEENGENISKSGHILETTEVNIY